jgi:spermidine/putrescine transport system ATP-binding protein
MVEVRGVTKRFGETVAVRSVSLAVRRGEFLTLLGPSGCGKTTLLRLIAGFESPGEGRIFLDGADVTELPPFRRNVNQVFQGYALFPHLDVERNIAFGLEMRRLPSAEIAEKVRRAIGLVSLEGKEKARPAALSGGQKQRVALARAIVCEPKVLLLDEPLSALDARLREQMQFELKQLQRRLGITFILVTHDQQEALTMSDRVAVMNRGAIEQSGTAADVYRKPATRFVAEFVGQTNLFSCKVVGRDAGGVILRIEDDLTLRAADVSMPAEGQLTLASCRPEKIRMTVAGSPELNTFPATVVEVVFRGQSDVIRVRTAGGHELTMVSTGKSPEKGEAVTCCIHPPDIVAVSEK